MTTSESKKGLKHVKYVGTRPKDDIENDCREKLCSLTKGVGGVIEIAAEKLYIVNLARNEESEAFCEKVDELERSPFIFWNFSYGSRIYYDNFDMDSGPLNLAVTHHFVSRIKVWLDTQPYRNPDKIIVIVLDDYSLEVKLNATLLVAISAMVLLNLTDEQVLKRFNFFMLWKYKPGEQSKQLVFREQKKFSDVSGCQSLMTLTLEDCVRAFYAALKNKFYDYYTFDQAEYLFYETVMSGDLNWIVPGKLLAFAGPSEKSKRPPSFYYHYFADHNVTNVVRLNDSEYSSKDFEDVGFLHDDLIFPDGYPPTSTIAKKFIRIVDNAAGAVAVHCYAGIGRTGTLIAAYLMARYNFTAAMAIAWTRICRPGSVIGGQQDWLLTRFDQYSVGQCKGSQATPSGQLNAKTEVELTATTTTAAVDTPLRTSSRQAQSRAEQTAAAVASADSKPETSFKVAERNYGQAKALVLTKKEREKQIFAKHRRQLFLKHREQSSRSSSRTRNAAAQRNSVGSESASSQTSEKVNAEPTEAIAVVDTKHVGLVLDLGKTIPFSLRFSDLAVFEGRENPKHYILEEGKYEWRVKFPDAGYVALRHDYLHDKNVSEFYTDNSAPRELMLNFKYRRVPAGGSKQESSLHDDGDVTEEQETALPRLVPIVFYSLFGPPIYLNDQ